MSQIAIDNWWPLRASSPSRPCRADRAPYTRSLMRGISGLAFVTDDVAKMLKNATYFPYNGLLWELPPRDLQFLKALAELWLSSNNDV